MFDFFFGALIGVLPEKALIVIGIALLYLIVIALSVYFIFLR